MPHVLEDEDEFGRRLGAARGYALLQRPAFAKLLGFSKETLRRLEIGDDEKQNRTVAERQAILQRAANVSGVTIEWLEAPAVPTADRISVVEAQTQEVRRSVSEIAAALREKGIDVPAPELSPPETGLQKRLDDAGQQSDPSRTRTEEQGREASNE